jgi:hypothetical protein
VQMTFLLTGGMFHSFSTAYSIRTRRPSTNIRKPGLCIARIAEPFRDQDDLTLAPGQVSSNLVPLASLPNMVLDCKNTLVSK